MTNLLGFRELLFSIQSLYNTPLETFLDLLTYNNNNNKDELAKDIRPSRCSFRERSAFLHTQAVWLWKNQKYNPYLHDIYIICSTSTSSHG